MASNWFTRNAKLIFKVNITLQFVLFAAYAAVITFLGCSPVEINEQEIYRWGVVAIGFLCQLHFALHSLIKSNLAEIVAFLIVSVLLSLLLISKPILAIYAVTKGSTAQTCPQKELVIGLSAFAGGVFIINQILFFITSFAVKKEYEWNALYKMGTDTSANEKYEKYLAVRAFIKMNFVMQILTAMANFFFVDGHWYMYAIDGSIVFVLFLFTYLGYQSFRYNKPRLFSTYLMFYIFAIAYQTYRTVMMIVHSDAGTKISHDKGVIANQIALVVSSVGVTLYVMIDGMKFFKMEGDIQAALNRNNNKDNLLKDSDSSHLDSI